MKWLRAFGPGLLVTAAFVGPGTITTCSKAGAAYGYDLAWALGFAVLATIILQEMAARLGLVTRAGLGEAVRTSLRAPWAVGLSSLLVVGAIAVGNAAYQFGNVTGAAAGLQSLAGGPAWAWSVGVGGAAFVLLASGSFRIVGTALVALVAVMSALFVLAAMAAQPDYGQIARGLLSPHVPTQGLVDVLALIGTTVVPYNLFLHASAAARKWPASVPLGQALRQSRCDTSLAIVLGGVISLAIMTTAAAAFARGTAIRNAADMTRQLENILGGAAQACFAVGLFAAGLTSAITAPLAAAYATCGVLGWQADLRGGAFRAVWIAILLAGTLLATLGIEPVQGIVFAQAANGLLLPLVAAFLLVAVNRPALMGAYRNRLLGNLLAGSVLLVAVALGAFQMLRQFGALR
jgi:manganese transport protein